MTSERLHFAKTGPFLLWWAKSKVITGNFGPQALEKSQYTLFLEFSVWTPYLHYLFYKTLQNSKYAIWDAPFRTKFKYGLTDVIYSLSRLVSSWEYSILGREGGHVMGNDWFLLGLEQQSSLLSNLFNTAAASVFGFEAGIICVLFIHVTLGGVA